MSGGRQPVSAHGPAGHREKEASLTFAKAVALRTRGATPWRLGKLDRLGDSVHRAPANSTRRGAMQRALDQLLQTELTVRAKPDELKVFVIGLAVDENKVRPDMAIAMVTPFACQCVIEIPAGQRRIRRQQIHHAHQQCIQLFAENPGFLPPVIAFETARIFNSPHSVA